MDLFRRIKDRALIKQGIQVVQLLGRRAVVGNGVARHVFREIRLDDGDPHLQQLAVLCFEPLDSIGVREIDSRAGFREAMHQGRPTARLRR